MYKSKSLDSKTGDRCRKRFCNRWRACVACVCDLTIASENAIFGQTGPRVGSFDAGFGSSYLARIVGQKKAREIWFLCRKYNAQEALDMGLVNKVVPLDKLEDEYVGWAEEMMLLSPLASV